MINKYAIAESVNQCSYPTNIRDYISGILIQLSDISMSAKIFKTSWKNETVMAVKYNVPTQFKDRSYDIPIIIYMSKNMPYEAPEVYLEKSSDTGVNPKNLEIDQKTNRILTPSLINWNSYSIFTTTLNEINASFNKNFPIYKLNSSNTSKSSVSDNSKILSNNNPNMMNMNGYSNTNNGFVNNSSSNPKPGTIYSNLFGNNNGTGTNTGVNPTNNNNTIYSNISTNTQTNPNQFVFSNPTNITTKNINNDTSNSNSTMSTFYNNLAKPPHQNSIYHTLYSNTSKSTSTSPNKSHISTSISPSNINTTNLTPNSTTNNKYNFYNNLIPNSNSYTNTLNSGTTGISGVNNSTSTTSTSSSTSNKPLINNIFSNPSTNSTTKDNNLFFNPNFADVFSNTDTKTVEDQIKKILIEEVKSALEAKIKEELKRNKQTEDKLKNYKNQFVTQIDKYTKYFGNKDEFLTTFTNYMSQSEKDCLQINTYIAKMQDKIICSNNIETYIQVGDASILKVIAMEATIEDMMNVARKAFEKKILIFGDTVRMIRNLTREAFKIKVYREKVIKQQI